MPSVQRSQADVDNLLNTSQASLSALGFLDCLYWLDEAKFGSCEGLPLAFAEGLHVS